MTTKGQTRKRIIAATTVSAAIFCLWTFNEIQRSREPSHDGKPLRYWVHVFYRPESEEPYYKVNQALLELGTNSAPLVAKALVQPTPKLRMRYTDVYFRNRYRMPRWLAKLLPEPGFPGFLRNRADLLLRQMGPNAYTAVPELIRGLGSKDPHTKRDCAEILGLIGSQAERAVPRLIAALEDPNLMIRGTAAVALGKIGRAPDKTVSALLNARKENRIPEVTSLEALRGLGYKPDEGQVTSSSDHSRQSPMTTKN